MRVRFDLPGDPPDLDETEAAELAELIEKRRTLIALKIAGKLLQAMKPASGPVKLEPEEMAVLLELLDEPSVAPDSEALSELRERLRLALNR